MSVITPFAEPTVEDMLADPIVRLVMQRDGVEEADLRLTLRRLALARSAARRGGKDGRQGVSLADGA